MNTMNNSPISCIVNTSKDTCQFCNSVALCIEGKRSQIDIENFQKLQLLTPLNIGIRPKWDHRLKAFETTLFIPVKIKEQCLPLGTTYLTRSTKKYNREFLFEKSFDFWKQHQISCGYYIEHQPDPKNGKPRDKNQLDTWMIPIKERRDSALSGDSTSMTLKIDSETSVIFEKVTLDNANLFYWALPDLVSGQHVSFFPDLDYFVKWITVFDTYLVIENEKHIGMFSIKMSYPSSTSLSLPQSVLKVSKVNLRVADIVWSVGNHTENINSAIRALIDKVDTLRGFLVGGIKSEVIENSKGHITNEKSILRVFPFQNEVNDIKSFGAPIFRPW